MLLNVYVVIDPEGDRPYISTFIPKHLDRKGGKIKVYAYSLEIPDESPPTIKFPKVVLPKPVE